MAWDDAPPTPEELTSTSGWDSKPPTTEEMQPIGKIQSFVRGAANNFPLAPQAIAGGEALTGLGDEGGYSKNLADWNAKAATAKAANPKTYGVGAFTGALAPLAIPGVGEGLEAAPILGNAAFGAAGAISNQDLTKNPKEIIKNLGEGAAIGGTLGAAGKLIGKGLGAAKEYIAPATNRIEANATAGALDLNSHAIRRLSPGSQNPEEVLQTINDKVQKLFPDLVGATDTAGSKLGKLVQAHDQASDLIGKVIDSTSEKTGGIIPEVNEAIENLTKESSKIPGLTSARNLDAQAELKDAATTLSELQKSGQLNFRNLYEVKKGIGQAYHNPNLENVGIDKAYGILSDAIDKILKRTTVDDPAMKAGFDHAKDIFKFTSDLIPAMKPGAAREAAGVGGGLLSAGLGTAAVMGHPAAIPAYVGKQASKFLAPDLAQNLTYKGMNAVKNSGRLLPKHFGQGLTQEIIDYINSKNQEPGR